MFDNPSGQLHQRSITSAFNYNRTYSILCVQVRRVVRRYNTGYGGYGGGGYKRVKRVKVVPSSSEDPAPSPAPAQETEPAAERLLNPFSLFNLVRFPNTACTTTNGEHSKRLEPVLGCCG